jgi:hypothetical protein
VLIYRLPSSFTPPACATCKEEGRYRGEYAGEFSAQYYKFLALWLVVTGLILLSIFMVLPIGGFYGDSLWPTVAASVVFFAAGYWSEAPCPMLAKKWYTRWRDCACGGRTKDNTIPTLELVVKHKGE